MAINMLKSANGPSIFGGSHVCNFEWYLINISLLLQEFKMEEVWIKEEPSSTEEVNNMIQIHEGKNSIECSRCDFTTKFKHVLNKHFLEVHDRKNQDHDSSPEIKSEPIDEEDVMTDEEFLETFLDASEKRIYSLIKVNY